MIERRKVPRTQIAKGAKIASTEEAGVYPCTVIDLTNLGAGIRMFEPALLPTHLELSFDDFRSTRNCRIIWRRNDRIGVVF
jgi:hypothetical protein